MTVTPNPQELLALIQTHAQLIVLIKLSKLFWLDSGFMGIKGRGSRLLALIHRQYLLEIGLLLIHWLYKLVHRPSPLHLLPAHLVFAPLPQHQNLAVQYPLQITYPGHGILLPNAFNAMTLHDPTLCNWNMDTCASIHLNDFIYSLSDVLNMCIYPSVSVGDGYPIPVTNSGHSILPTPHRSLHLNNVLITPNIVKNLISIRQFVRDK
ncbi:hypothetical protein Tco_1476912 [Tanacetum coccineum]